MPNFSKSKSSYQRSANLSRRGPLKRVEANACIGAIWSEYTRRLGNFHTGEFEPTKNESAKNFLRREIYALGIHLLRYPTSWDVQDLAEKVRGRATTRPDIRSQIFRALLMSTFERDNDLSRQERSAMAMELEYAHQHTVPPELLCGFIYQSGPRKDVTKKLDAKYVEPAFVGNHVS